MITEPDFYSVVEKDDGSKWLVYTGYFYWDEAWCGYEEDGPRGRFVEINKSYGYYKRIPETDDDSVFMRCIDMGNICDEICGERQDIYDFTEGELEFEVSHYYDDDRYVALDERLVDGSGRGTHLDWSKVNYSTPCGNYWC